MMILGVWLHLAKNDPVIELLVHVWATFANWQEVSHVLAIFVNIRCMHIFDVKYKYKYKYKYKCKYMSEPHLLIGKVSHILAPFVYVKCTHIVDFKYKYK